MFDSIQVFDLRKKRFDFLTDEGHVETIFDCHFKPSDPDSMSAPPLPGTSLSYISLRGLYEPV